MPDLRNGNKGGFEPGLTRLRVRHSTTELPRSIEKNETIHNAISEVSKGDCIIKILTMGILNGIHYNAQG